MASMDGVALGFIVQRDAVTIIINCDRHESASYSGDRVVRFLCRKVTGRKHGTHSEGSRDGRVARRLRFGRVSR